MRTKAVLVLISAILIARSLPASSARTIHPQLVGLTSVALNFSPQTVPGLDTATLEQQVRSRLEAAGLATDSSAPTNLFVQITYQRLPACPDYLVIRTHVALSEDAVIQRGQRSETVYVDTWKESEDFVEPIAKAAEIASASTLGLVNYLLDAREYTASVMAKRK